VHFLPTPAYRPRDDTKVKISEKVEELLTFEVIAILRHAKTKTRIVAENKLPTFVVE
jgi:hypothetical protein